MAKKKNKPREPDGGMADAIKRMRDAMKERNDALVRAAQAEADLGERDEEVSALRGHVQTQRDRADLAVQRADAIAVQLKERDAEIERLRKECETLLAQKEEHHKETVRKMRFAEEQRERAEQAEAEIERLRSVIESNHGGESMALLDELGKERELRDQAEAALAEARRSAPADLVERAKALFRCIHSNFPWPEVPMDIVRDLAAADPAPASGVDLLRDLEARMRKVSFQGSHDRLAVLGVIKAAIAQASQPAALAEQPDAGVYDEAFDMTPEQWEKVKPLLKQPDAERDDEPLRAFLSYMDANPDDPTRDEAALAELAKRALEGR